MRKRRPVNRSASQRQKPSVAVVAQRSKPEVDPLGALREAYEEECYAAVRRDARVRDARKAGATWTEIARVLGISPQAVQQRYGRQLLVELDE